MPAGAAAGATVVVADRRPLRVERIRRPVPFWGVRMARGAVGYMGAPQPGGTSGSTTTSTVPNLTGHRHAGPCKK